MEYHQITLNEYLDLKNKIAEKLNNMAADYITVGYLLKKVRDTDAYKQDGYESLTEFAKSEYGLSESATSRFIAINTKFSVDGNTPILQETFKKFGSSQLSEMLTLSDEDIKLIKETTTVATIREIKKFNKQEPEETEEIKNDEIPVNTSTGNDFHKIIIEFFKENKELLDEAWQQSTEEDIAEIISPNGNRTFKKGLFMIFFYEHKDGIALKKFGQQTAISYTYYDLMAAMVEIYKDYYEDGKSVHEAYYGSTQVESTKNDSNKEAVEKELESDSKEPEIVTETEETVSIEPESVLEKSKIVSKEPENDSKEDKTVKLEVVPGVEVEIEDVEKASMAAVEEEYKAELEAHHQIATSQVNTRDEEEIKEEVICEVVSNVNRITVLKKMDNVMYQENGITIASESCIDDIIHLITNEISRQVANNNMICEITFRRE